MIPPYIERSYFAVRFFIDRDGVMEPTWKIRRIGIRSAMKVGAVISCGAGFIIGTVLSVFFGFFVSALSSVAGVKPPSMSPALVILLPFVAALFYTVLGTALTFLVTLLFNIAAGATDGIEIEIDMDLRDDSGSFI